MGLETIEQTSQDLAMMSAQMVQLCSALRRIGLEKISEEILQYSRETHDMSARLRIAHTMIISDLVAGSEQATVNMIAAALSTIPNAEDKI